MRRSAICRGIRYSPCASKKLLDLRPRFRTGTSPVRRPIRTAAQPFEDPAPGLSLAELDRIRGPLLERMAVLVESSDTNIPVTSQRLNGNSATLAMHQMVQHVVNRGTYHRGQIAAMLKQNGHTLPPTDLVLFQLGL